MPVTDINICSRALIRLGQSTIADFTANDKSVICGTIYPQFSKNLLCLHNWRFARKKALLPIGTAPMNAYKNAFDLPADYLTVVRAYNSSNQGAKPLTNGYERFGNQILTNNNNMLIDYIYNIDESLWPFWYQEFVVTALAAELAIAITEDEGKENFYRNKAWGPPSLNGDGGMFKVAKRIDARQQPIKPFSNIPLLSARFA